MALRTALLGLLGIAAACSPGIYSIPLMPAPMMLEGTEALIGVPSGRHPGILYATSRDGTKPEERFYSWDRGDVMRAGVAEVALETQTDSRSLYRLVLDPNRGEELLLRLKGTRELGILSYSVTGLTHPSVAASGTPRADSEFIREIDRRMRNSDTDEVTIYVHGYRVPFAEPSLVSAELWHFLNYEGAFVAFSWPSTQRLSAYVRDVDTARIAAKDLRQLVEFIGSNTRVRKINLIGYSMGTRVVLDAVHQLEIARKRHRSPAAIGNVILAGSDVDRGFMAALLKDGLLDNVGSLTVYMSDSDLARDFARLLSRRGRVGQSLNDDDLPPHVRAYLRGLPKLELVDVADADRYAAGNGHGYFRESPWVSNDLLVKLRQSVSPGERGLFRPNGEAVWRFPEDYPSRARSSGGLIVQK